MRGVLAAVLILLLGAGSWAASPPPAADAPAAASEVERSLALLDKIDPQTLPPAQRQTLYFGLADALLGDARPERALDFLARARQSAPADELAATDEQIRRRLPGIATPVLAAALQAGTPLAGLLQSELARRGVAGTGGGPAIGVLLPLSGRHAPFGEEVRQGLELAHGSETSPARVRLIYLDSAAAGTDVAAQVRELAGRPEVLGVIGPLTAGEAAAAARQAEQSRLPLLLLAAREGATGGFVFRNALTAAAQTQALAGYAREQGAQRFLIFHPASRSGELSAGLFQVAVERQGGRVLARQDYPPDTLDLRDQLQALAAAGRRGGGNPDALFIPDSASQVAQIIPQLAFPKLDQLQLLGTSAWHDPELGRIAGPLSEGAVFVDGFFADSARPEVRDFVARHQAAYGTPPSILAAQGFDAGRIMLSLLARPEVRDRAALRQALAALHDFPGVTGPTRFGADGEAEKPLFLLQLQDGRVVQIN